MRLDAQITHVPMIEVVDVTATGGVDVSIPVWATAVELYAIGAGGGSGSSSGGNVDGGGPGGGGGECRFLGTTLSAKSTNATINVDLGTGGAAASAGGSGGAGNPTVIRWDSISGTIVLQANAGGGGVSSDTGGTGGSGGTGGTGFNGGAGGACPNSINTRGSGGGGAANTQSIGGTGTVGTNSGGPGGAAGTGWLPAGAGANGNSTFGSIGVVGNVYGGGAGGGTPNNATARAGAAGAIGFARIVFKNVEGDNTPGSVPAPVFQLTGTVATGTTAVNANYPAGIAAGDTLYYWVGANSAPTSIANVAGWTGLTTVTNGQISGRLFWKIAVGTETGAAGSVATAGANNTAGVVIAVRGAQATGTPFEAAGTATGASTNVAYGTITTTNNAELGIVFGALDDNVAGTPGTGWTEAVDASATAMQIFVDWKEITTAGVEPSQNRVLGTSETYLLQKLAALHL